MKNLFLLFIPVFVFGQKKTINQNLNYFRYQLIFQANKNWTFRNEAENRSYFLLGRQNQFVIKIIAEKKVFKNNIIAGGFAFSKATGPQDPEASITNNTFELRPYFYLSHKVKLFSKHIFNFQLKEDFRFFQREEDCYRYGNLRSRFLIEYNFNLNKEITLKAFNEIMFNVLRRNDVNFFDQNRIGASVQFNVNKNNSIEIGYANWYQKQNDDLTYLDKNICRITFQKRIKLY